MDRHSARNSMGSPPSVLYSAWYYYECLPDADGLYSFFSPKPHIKTNWPTPGMVPNGLGVQIHTVRLIGLDKCRDETDKRNWLLMKIANMDTPLALPPFVLYGDREMRLPLPVQLSEAAMFMFNIHIDASKFIQAPENRGTSPALTLFIGVTEARSF